MNNPFSNNNLQTRADLQKAVADLFMPLKAHFSSGAARVKVGHTGAHFDDAAAELEGFARPLWRIVPLVAGGGDFADWDLYHRGLTNGTNPDHIEYWGLPADRDQRLVEMAAIGLALLMLPEQVWKPLSVDAQRNLANWLRTINSVDIVDNNWLWFRVVSLRQMQGEIGDEMGTQVGLRKLNQVAQSVKTRPAIELTSVPPVMMLDVIEVTLLRDTDELQKDKSGRKRRIKKREKVCVLVALGIYPQNQRWGILDWE